MCVFTILYGMPAGFCAGGACGVCEAVCVIGLMMYSVVIVVGVCACLGVLVLCVRSWVGVHILVNMYIYVCNRRFGCRVGCVVCVCAQSCCL